MKIKAFLLTIVVIFSVMCSISCTKDREYDEQEVLSAAEVLIKRSENLNEIYYGYGIDYIEDMNTSIGDFYEADYDSLKRYGVFCIEDIKLLTRECFTNDLSNIIINTKLSSVSDEDGIQELARYSEKTLDGETILLVYKNADVYLTDKVVYDYSSLYVSDVEGEEVFVNVTVTVTNKDGDTQTKELKIALLEESDGWRLNSPTYTKYVDRSYYDDLQNK